MSASRPPSTWRERVLAWRNRLVADPGFQRWAARFPLTRSLARRRARSLFDLCAGFVYSQILTAFVRLDLHTILFEGPWEVQALSSRVSIAPDRLQTLLRATTALGLTVALDEDRYALGELGAALVGSPGVSAMIEHHAMLYADLRDPVGLLRDDRGGTSLGVYWPYAAHGSLEHLVEDQVAAYSALMSASQPLIADDVLDAYPIRRHRVLMDVGGGEGRFLAAAADRAPRLDLVLFDLPPVVARAETHLSARGLGGRVRVYGGDFQVDPLPPGADLISLVRILHDHDDDVVMALLRSVYTALPESGGSVLIAEPMSGAAGAEPVGDAYFGFYLLAMGRGRPRRPAELTEMLQAAGFRHVREIPTPRPMLTAAIVARKE